MLDRRSLLVQGIGYGLAAIALQGFIAVTIDLPKTLTASGGYGPVRLSTQQTSVKFRLKGQSAELVRRSLEARASASADILGVKLATKFGKVQAKGRSVILSVAPKVFKATTAGKLHATGFYDISDEELTAMILELLNA